MTTLTGPDQGRPDVEVTLTARLEKVTIPGGPTLTAYTLNGTTPGPTIRAMEGDLVLEPSRPGQGAAFTVLLPGEPGYE